jgi:hypothetical protein
METELDTFYRLLVTQYEQIKEYITRVESTAGERKPSDQERTYRNRRGKAARAKAVFRQDRNRE